MNTKSYIVHFIGSTGTSFKVGTYKTKKAIRRAQDKYDMQYGAYLGVKVLDPETLREVSLSEVA